MLLLFVSLMAIVQCNGIHTPEDKDEEHILEKCRRRFSHRPEDGGGFGTFTKGKIQKLLQPGDMRLLTGFTGLTEDEVYIRVRRNGRFHHVGEYKFWNPQSETETTWFYRTSVNYLFGNLWHDQTDALSSLSPRDGPVLEFSGGTGNNIVYLAKKGIQTMYMGIGLVEYAFAEYRVSALGLERFVKFLKPYGPATRFNLNAALALPRDGTIGTILAFDVLEHINHYEFVVKSMVESLRRGGCIYESSPFEEELLSNATNIRIHRSSGGISMQEAMGKSMKLKRKVSHKYIHSVWCKDK